MVFLFGVDTTIGDTHITITISDGTRSVDETFAIKVVDGSQFLLSEVHR
jgi:hypothetical protein